MAGDNDEKWRCVHRYPFSGSVRGELKLFMNDALGTYQTCLSGVLARCIYHFKFCKCVIDAQVHTNMTPSISVDIVREIYKMINHVNCIQ